MPGIHSSDSVRGSYISDWFLYRSALSADDDTVHPEQVSQIIDLSTSVFGVDSEIWIAPQLVSGAGTIKLTLIGNNFGSLANLSTYTTVREVNSVDSLTWVVFSDLMATVYRVLITRQNNTSVWNLHAAVSDPTASGNVDNLVGPLGSSLTLPLLQINYG